LKDTYKAVLYLKTPFILRSKHMCLRAINTDNLPNGFVPAFSAHHWHLLISTREAFLVLRAGYIIIPLGMLLNQLCLFHILNIQSLVSKFR
jgi:hypothetical protein